MAPTSAGNRLEREWKVEGTVEEHAAVQAGDDGSVR